MSVFVCSVAIRDLIKAEGAECPMCEIRGCSSCKISTEFIQRVIDKNNYPLCVQGHEGACLLSREDNMSIGAWIRPWYTLFFS